VGLAIGWIVGIASTIIGLREYANDLFTKQEIRDSIPGIGQAIGLALEGSAQIWLYVLIMGFIIFMINRLIIWLINNHNLKKRQ